jgi:hypothetical protein
MSRTNYTMSRSSGSEKSTVYQETEIDARHCSSDALMAYAEVFRADAEDPDPEWPGELGRFNAGERLRAIEAELARRDRISTLPASRAAIAAKEHEKWAELARIVRETVFVPDVLILIGCHVRPGGNGRQRPEFHSDCPVCQEGDDRLVSWGGPSGRCWCRKCGWSADVITVAQSFLPGCEHFRDALKVLARLAALNLSDVALVADVADSLGGTR